jgi:hypothetical protein
MKIALMAPAAQWVRSGNRHTGARWAAMLRALGHRVSLSTAWDGESADAMLALHGRRRRSHCTWRFQPAAVGRDR